MSVQTQIDRIKGNVTDAFNAVSNKGGAVPTSKVSENLASAIDSIPTGVTLPTLDNPAAAADLVSGKSLYDQNGNVVTGTLAETEVGTKIFGGTGIQINGTPGSTTFNIGGIYQENHIGDNTIGFITRPGAQLWVRDAPTSLFGDAAASDVAKGKTFTSAAGLLVEGTHECEGGVTLPEGAVVVQKVLAAQASQQISSGYSLSVTYGDNVEINDSIALNFTGTTQNLSNISNTTDFSVLSGKYVRTGSSYGITTGTIYYIPDGATFTVGGQSMNKTLTCDKAQKVSMKKVSV